VSTLLEQNLDDFYPVSVLFFAAAAFESQPCRYLGEAPFRVTPRASCARRDATFFFEAQTTPAVDVFAAHRVCRSGGGRSSVTGILVRAGNAPMRLYLRVSWREIYGTCLTHMQRSARKRNVHLAVTFSWGSPPRLTGPKPIF